MRYLWKHYGKKNIGVQEGQIEVIASKITGKDLSDFFNNYLYDVMELPLESLLNEVGITYHLRETVSVDDKGGNESKTVNPVSFGARFTADTIGAKITHCFTDESAERAGIAAGDVVISINHLQVNKTNIETVISSYAVGDRVKVHAFRRDELMEFDVVLQQAELTTCYLTLDEKSDTKVAARRSSWLLLQ
jgi:predicted metalloprotease with PDZ domain